MTVPQKHLVGHGLQLFPPLFCLSPLARFFSAPSFSTVCLRKNSLAPFSAAFLPPSPRFQNGPRNCPRSPPLPYPYPTMLFFVFIRHFWRLFSLLPLPTPEGACKGLMAFLPSVLSVPYILCNNIQKGAMYCDSISLHRIPQPRFLSLFLAPPSPIEQHPLSPLGERKIPLFLYYVLFSFSRSPLCSPQFYLRKDGGESYTTCVWGHWSLRQKQQSWRWDGEEGGRVFKSGGRSGCVALRMNGQKERERGGVERKGNGRLSVRWGVKV